MQVQTVNRREGLIHPALLEVVDHPGLPPLEDGKPSATHHVLDTKQTLDFSQVMVRTGSTPPQPLGGLFPKGHEQALGRPGEC